MTDAAQANLEPRTRKFTRINIVRIALTLIFIVAVVPVAPRIVGAFAHYGFHPHLPDAGVWNGLAPQIKFHIFSAVAAFGLGTVMMLRPKGVGLHKALGWGWVAAMGATAVSSLFITGLNGNFYSLIHLLSGWTVVALPMAVYAIRTKRVMLHRRVMTGLYFGGMLVAGALAFIPGRAMYMMFFG